MSCTQMGIYQSWGMLHLSSINEYIQLIVSLLPQGLAWNTEPDSNLMKLLQPLADEAVRLHNRADSLVEQVDPSSTTELIADWERVLGLPDNCGMRPVSLQQRRNAVVAKLTSVGGQTPQYYINLAKTLGFTITITEFRPFQAGRSKAGDPVVGDEWAYYWQVNAPETTVIEFKAGQSAAGEPLRSWGNELLECLINRYKPAHTGVIFAYG